MSKVSALLRSAKNSGEPYCPELYDVIHLQFDPQAGREQADKRYAIVLTPKKYNQITGLCVVCPITTQAKGYPFEAAVPPGGKTTGVVLCDHVKSLDWRARNSEFFENRPDIAPEVLGKLRALLGLNPPTAK